MKKLLVALAVSVMGVFGLMGVESVFAAGTCPDGTTPYEHSVAECSIPTTPGGTSDNLMESVNKIINVVIGLVGLVAVAVMIIGGIYFLLSQGDSAKITRARNTILYGVVGLVIALLSFAIVNFVISGISGSSTGGTGAGTSGAPTSTP